MKYAYHYIFFAIFLATSTVTAQLDSLQQLPEVILTDAKMLHFSKGFKVEKLNDSVIDKNNGSLTETLRYNTSIYFKENGYGMVSSPSFRGTNAAQTAVIWNGININSIFTGQTDFNIISPLDFDEISVRSGGGGVQYGSGAVGGSVHLNNNFSFRKLDTTQFGLQYGSFSTYLGNFKTRHGNNNTYFDVGADYINSENDYDYPGKDVKNNHGAFQRFSANANAATKFGKQLLNWNSSYTYSDRDFSGTENTIAKDNYRDVTTRNRLAWVVDENTLKSTTTAAHIFESYRYYPDSEKPYYTEGNANTFLGGYEAEVILNKKIRLNASATYTYIDATGDNVGENTRETLAAVFLMNHNISEKLSYGVNLRKEFLNEFDNPLLFSVDANLQLSPKYALRVNASKNYRIPTFNDLYWSSGGNPNLQAETSYQAELGQVFSFKNLSLDLAAYYISSTNLIKWVPVNGTIWQPVNISETRNYGLEAMLNYSVKLNKEHKLNFNANYSYTNAEDIEKRKQLIYVPYHKSAGVLQYNFKNFMTYVQGLYTSEAFTTTDNKGTVESSTIFNLGVEYSLRSNPKITLGCRLKNIFNTYYENVAYRPMPSKNFQIFLNFNI